MTPIVIIILLVGFVVFVVIAIRSDVKNGEKFSNEIKEKYPMKDSFGVAYVTEKGELLYYYPSGDNVIGYKKWNLEDIGYISTHKGSFSVLDHNKKTMCGEYLTPSERKFLKEQEDDTFDVGSDWVYGYVEFIKKHGTHIQHMSDGEIQE